MGACGTTSDGYIATWEEVESNKAYEQALSDQASRRRIGKISNSLAKQSIKVESDLIDAKLRLYQTRREP